MPDARLAELVLRLPGLRVLTAPNELEHYGRDWTRRWLPAPLAIALPTSVEEVQAHDNKASKYYCIDWFVSD